MRIERIKLLEVVRMINFFLLLVYQPWILGKFQIFSGIFYGMHLTVITKIDQSGMYGGVKDN